MLIPADIRSAVLDLLRIPDSDTSNENLINESFSRVLDQLCREQDWFVERQHLDVTARHYTYLLDSRTTRALAVLFNRTHLQHVPMRTLDLLAVTWQTAAPGTPEDVVLNQIPPGIDGLTSISPHHILIHPAPKAAATGDAALTVFAVMTPQALVMPWLSTYLILAVTGTYCGLKHERRDENASQYWLTLAGMFLNGLTVKLPS